MKKLIAVLVLAVLLGLAGCSTMMGDLAPEEQRSAEYVYEFPQQTADSIFLAASTWFVETFVASDSVIELRDIKELRIAGKYTYEYWEGAYGYRIRTTIIVDAREGRARIIMRDPYFTVTDSILSTTAIVSSYRPLVSQTGIDKAQEEWAAMALSFRTYVEKASGSDF